MAENSANLQLSTTAPTSAAAAFIYLNGSFGTIEGAVATALNKLGTLVDADLAKESANLQALQTRQQLGVQSLSLANQGSQTLLSLFR